MFQRCVVYGCKKTIEEYRETGKPRKKRSCFDAMARLSPGLHFVQFVTQPEVKFHVFGQLKRGEENLILKFFFMIFISGSHVDSMK